MFPRSRALPHPNLCGTSKDSTGAFLDGTDATTLF